MFKKEGCCAGLKNQLSRFFCGCCKQKTGGWLNPSARQDDPANESVPLMPPQSSLPIPIQRDLANVSVASTCNVNAVQGDFLSQRLRRKQPASVGDSGRAVFAGSVGDGNGASGSDSDDEESKSVKQPQ